MAQSVSRSAMKNLFSLRGSALRRSSAGTPKRKFSSSSLHDDDCERNEEMGEITFAGIATCSVLAFYNLSKGHPHFDEAPACPYLHIRNKEFPWGPDGLFEKKHTGH